MRPRRTACVRRRMQDRFDLRLPAAAALPTSNRPSRCQPGSAKRLRPQARAGDNRRKAAALRRRQWGARKEKQGPYNDHPRKPHPRLQLLGSTSQFCLCRAHPVQTCKSGTHRLARPVSLFGKARGTHENPAKRFSWGEEKETERCETCPSGRGEYSEVSFDDNGGIPVTGLPVQIFTACPAPAAPARYRAGPTG